MNEMNKDDGLRLAKHLAATHGLSRTQAEAYIEGGFVKVNGKVIELPQHRVKGDERIDLDTAAKLTPTVPMTILWHKPAGVPADMALAGLCQAITLASRSGIDRSGIRLLQKHLKEQVCVTPLETGASGLVIYTQDFPIKRKLVQDTLLIEHEIMVDVLHATHPDEAKAVESNAKLDESLRMLGRMVGSKAKVALSKQTDKLAGLRFAVKGYEPGVTADLCHRAGLEVDAMRRIRIGRMPLAGLEVGQWRFLLGYERF
jgi:23S rRNA pseudouridine2604 synthase